MGSADTATTLDQLKNGVRATVTGLAEDDEDAVRKILSLGIVPGDEILVLATWPAIVFELGSTSYALDVDLARRIRAIPTTN